MSLVIVSFLSSTFVLIPTESPFGFRSFSMAFRSFLVTNAMEGSTDLIPTNSICASRDYGVDSFCLGHGTAGKHHEICN